MLCRLGIAPPEGGPSSHLGNVAWVAVLSRVVAPVRVARRRCLSIRVDVARARAVLRAV